MLIYIPVVIVIAYRQTDSVEQQIRLAIDNEALAMRYAANATVRIKPITSCTPESNNSSAPTESIRLLNVICIAGHQSYAPSTATWKDSPTRCPTIYVLPSSNRRFLQHHRAAPGRRFLRSVIALSPAHINENMVRMSTLIDDLLEFSRCGRQPIEKYRRFHMAALARTAAAEAVSAMIRRRQSARLRSSRCQPRVATRT